MTLAIHIAKDRVGAYRAWCPALPGCEVLAKSLGEARTRIQDAVRGYVSRLEQTLPRELGRLFSASQGVAGSMRAQAA